MRKLTLILALLCALAGGARATQTTLSVDPGSYLFFVGDSQTQCQFIDPSQSEIATDTTLWQAGNVPWLFPTETGIRRTGISAYLDAQIGTSNVYADPYTPTASDFVKLRTYSHAATWGNRLATLLGCNTYATLAMGGATLTSSKTDGVSNENGLSHYILHNPHVKLADLITIHIGINDIGYNITADSVIAEHKRAIAGVRALNPSAKILVLGVQPFGSATVGSDPTKLARGDSLDDWIAGRSPYTSDGSGAGYSLEGYFASDVSSGKLAGFSYAHWLRDDGGGSVGPEDASNDTLAVGFGDPDGLHKNWRGDQLLAQLIGRHVFGLTVPDGADTTDVGDWPTPQGNRQPKTIYVDIATGDNFMNWANPTSPNRPMATLQGALFRAQPGDSIVLAPGEYCEYWDKTVDGYFKPWVYQSAEADRISINGQGSTLTAQTGVASIYVTGSNAKAPTARPDSLIVAKYDLHNFEFVDWNGSGVSPWPLTSITGLHFYDCTWTNCNKWVSLIKQSGIDHTTAMDVELHGCTMDGWDVTGTNYGFHVAAGATGFPWTATIEGCAITDLTGAKNAMVYTNNTGVSTTSAGRLTFVGNTVEVDSMAEAMFNLDNDADFFLVANTIQSGATNTYSSNYEFIKTSNSQSGDTLVVMNNVIEYISQPFDAAQHSLWADAMEVYVNNLHNFGPDSLCNVDANYQTFEYAIPRAAANTGSEITVPSDTVYFGGALAPTKAGFTGYTMASFGLTTGPNHASIGPTQYTERPWLGITPVATRESYARIETLFGLLQLVNAGVLPPSDSLDVGTYYEVPYPETAADKLRFQLMIQDPYNAWPAANQQKIRLVIP